MKASTTRRGALDMQVCVPAEWSDAQVYLFAESDNPCGTKYGWHIVREGNPKLNGASERVVCASDNVFVHIMLDAG